MKAMGNLRNFSGILFKRIPKYRIEERTKWQNQ